jgi:trehalose synthase
MPQEVEVPARETERFRAVLGAERYDEFARAAEEGRRLLEGRVVWNVNSTARGGGVVELLRPLVGYTRGLGVDARWLVIDGTPEFFELTKRIHNRLHGSEGDGGPLDERARRLYEDVVEQNVAGFRERVQAGDVVIVHDPQPAGLVPHLRAAGAAVIWRCHVGIDHPNDLVRSAWAFLLPYVEPAHVYVFHRRSFIWDGLEHERVVIIPPTIDVFTPKNEDLDQATVQAILRRSAVLAGDEGAPPVVFTRPDGTPGRVERQVRAVEDERLQPETPLLVQVSRWDMLKDPLGVIRGFAEHVPLETGAHLLYAGPDVESVADDPEGTQVLRESIAARMLLPPEVRRRIHLVSLPMEDLEENAVMVNALQRHATVIAQKSVAEGFGLTVAEAMWKSRPVVASRVGGIQDQIVDGESGVLVDPTDLASFGAAVTRLLTDRPLAERMGRAARERVRDHFISVRSLLDYYALIRRILRASTGDDPHFPGLDEDVPRAVERADARQAHVADPVGEVGRGDGLEPLAAAVGPKPEQELQEEDRGAGRPRLGP